MRSVEPFLNDLLVDIEECKDPNLNDCDVNAICINTPGSFNCSCIDHYFGDGMPRPRNSQ